MTNQLQKEVRIGNYLLGKVEDELDDRKVYWEAYQIKDSNDFAGIIYDWDKPIPLTEEWLLRVGFKWSHFHPDTGQRAYYTLKDFGIELFDKKYYKNRLEILYVHQLQNLYFALTNEELTIKDEANGRP